MFLDTVFTVWINVISLVPIPESLMLSIHIRWLILLPYFVSGHPIFIFCSTFCQGIMDTTKGSGDNEFPLKIPLLMLTSANLFPALVSNVFLLDIVFLRKLMVFYQP